MSNKSTARRLPAPYQQGEAYDFRRRSDRLRWARLHAKPPYDDAEFIASEVIRRSVKTLYSWEGRRRELKDVGTLVTLAQSYDVSFSWLATGIGPRETASPSQQEAYALDWYRRQPPTVRAACVQFMMALDGATAAS